MSAPYRLIDVKDEILSLTGKTVKQLRTADKAMAKFFFPDKEITTKISDHPDYGLIGQTGSADHDGIECWYNLYKVSEDVAFFVKAYDGGNTNEAIVLSGNVDEIKTLFEYYFN